MDGSKINETDKKVTTVQSFAHGTHLKKEKDNKKGQSLSHKAHFLLQFTSIISKNHFQFIFRFVQHMLRVMQGQFSESEKMKSDRCKMNMRDGGTLQKKHEDNKELQGGKQGEK